MRKIYFFVQILVLTSSCILFVGLSSVWKTIKDLRSITEKHGKNRGVVMNNPITFKQYLFEAKSQQKHNLLKSPCAYFQNILFWKNDRKEP